MEFEDRVTTGNRVSPVASMYHAAIRASAWPREPHGWLFLGELVEQLGKSMFAEWKPYSSYGLLPDVAVGTTYQGVFIEPDEQLRYARWLLNDRKDDIDFIYRANKPFAYLDSEDNERTITDDEWSVACDMSQQEWAIGLGNQRMFREVQERIVEEAEAGRIVIGSRPLQGGQPKQTPLDWWFTDHYWSRFARLTIDPNDPFSEKAPSRDVAHQMFARTDSLGALFSLTDERTPSAATGNSIHSPYVRLMLEVADVMRISPSHQPKKESIKGELQARWEAYSLPASANLMNTAATLLREPESQAGRARK